MGVFNCDCCGRCCQSLKLFGEHYKDLDDGSGTCRYFDKSTSLCSIYENRPLKCRVEEGFEWYQKTYGVKLSFDKYISECYKGCDFIKAQWVKDHPEESS